MSIKEKIAQQAFRRLQAKNGNKLINMPSPNDKLNHHLGNFQIQQKNSVNIQKNNNDEEETSTASENQQTNNQTDSKNEKGKQDEEEAKVKGKIKKKAISFIIRHPFILILGIGVILIFFLILVFSATEDDSQPPIVYDPLYNFNNTFVNINGERIILEEYVIRSTYLQVKNSGVDLSKDSIQALMIINKTNALSQGNYNFAKKEITLVDEEGLFDLDKESKEYENMQQIYDEISNYLYLFTNYNYNIETLSNKNVLNINDIINKVNIDYSYEEILDTIYNGEDASSNVFNGEDTTSGEKKYSLYDMAQHCKVISTDNNNSAYAYNYSSNCDTSTENANLLTFLKTFEGNVGYCNGNEKEYIAKLTFDGKITIGNGITNSVIGDTSIAQVIQNNQWEKYFHKNGNGGYKLNDGDCVPVEIIDKIKIISIQNIFAAPIDKECEKLNISLTQFQKDALTSFNYNVGPGHTSELLAAYNSGGYEGLWKEMKSYYNSKGKPLKGLKCRRKAEFALFVTGDYTDQGKFHNRDLKNYDDYNSEGVMSRQAVCYDGGLEKDPQTGFMMRVSRPLRTNPIYYNQQNNQLAFTDFEGECAWYAGHRAKEILKNINSSKTWNSMPDGKDYCNSSEVTSGQFKKSTNVNAPKQGALVSWGYGSWGHVAVVERVNHDGTLLISEGSIGFGAVPNRETLNGSWVTKYGSRKNARKQNCELNNSGCYNLKTMTIDKVKSGFLCYIYLLDN